MVFHLSAPYADLDGPARASGREPHRPRVFEGARRRSLRRRHVGRVAAPERTSWRVGPQRRARRSPDGVTPTRVRAPCIQTLEEHYILDNRTRTDTFVNGEFDAIYAPGSGRTPDAARRGAPGVEEYTQVVNGGSVMYINEDAGAEGGERPGADPHVRRAIALALDPTVINERVYGGKARSGQGLPRRRGRRSTPTRSSRWPTDPEEATPVAAGGDGRDGLRRFALTIRAPIPRRASTPP